MLGTDDEGTQPRASLRRQRPQCPSVKLRQVQQEVVRDASEAAQTGCSSSTSSRRDCDPSVTRQASIHTRGWTSRTGAGIPRPRSPEADLDPRSAQLWRERQPPEPGWPGSPPHAPFGLYTCVHVHDLAYDVGNSWGELSPVQGVPTSSVSYGRWSMLAMKWGFPHGRFAEISEHLVSTGGVAGMVAPVSAWRLIYRASCPACLNGRFRLPR